MSTLFTPVPRVERGKLLTAAIWNDMARTVNGALGARDLEPGYTAAEGDAAVSLIGSETTRSSATVRIENPEDATQYVDVDRPTSITFRLSNGTNLKLNFS